MKSIRVLILLLILPLVAFSQKEQVIKSLEGKQAHYSEVAKQIWEYAELAYMESKSSTLLQNELSDIKSPFYRHRTNFQVSYRK